MTRLTLAMCIALGGMVAKAQADGLAYKRKLIGKIGMERSFDAFDERLSAEFQRLDTDEDGGITYNDLAAALNLQMAEARARFMVSWLRNDVNGDFDITANELRQSVRFRSLSQGGRGALPPPEKVAATIREKIAERLEIDTNADATISLEELSDAAKTRAMVIVRNKSAQTLPGDELDLNCDDAITKDEFVSVFREVFQIADLDKNGELSRAEFTKGLSRDVMDTFVPSGKIKECDEP